MTRAGIQWTALAFLGLLLPQASAQEAGPTGPQGEERTGLVITPTVRKGRLSVEERSVSLDFNNIEIKDFVKIISQLTGKDFILGENVRGKITIISPTKVSVDEAYKVFESVLAVNGLAAVQTGKVINIIPSRDAGRSPIRTFVSREPVLAGDTIVTQLVSLKYIDANDMGEIVKNFLSSIGNSLPYAPTNILILTDYASNINRILKIVRELDTDIYKQIVEVIPLQYASAQAMAGLLTNLFQQTGGALSKTRAIRGPGTPPPQAGQLPTKIIPEERTNSLIIVATLEDLVAMKDLIKKLDVKITGGGQIHVHYLQNADAEKLSATLSALAGGGAPARAAAPPGGAPAAGAAVAQFEGGIRITADKSTNSLVIVSTPSDYDVLRGVIEKLDLPRRQVYVEAAILELSLAKQKQLGIEFRYVTPQMKGVIGGTDFGVGMDALTIPPTTGVPLIPSGLSLAQVNGIFQLGSQSFLSVGAFLNALQSDNDVNTLSTPNLLATDNEPAEIIVGQNIPILTSTQAVVQTGLIAPPTINRQDIGLKLKITPQINESDFVRLNINTEISDVIESAGGVNPNLQGVTTSKRSAQTVVVARDRQTVIIGGLLQDRMNVTETKVPILGDIPIIGWLFRTTKKASGKTNLLIFLTPYILRGPGDMEAMRKFKEDESRKFEQESFGFVRERRSFGSSALTPPPMEAPSPAGEGISGSVRPSKIEGASVTEGAAAPPPGLPAPGGSSFTLPGLPPTPSTVKEDGEGAQVRPKPQEERPGEMGVMLQPIIGETGGETKGETGGGGGSVTGTTLTGTVQGETLSPAAQPLP